MSRILMFGATGTIGRATVRALVAREHEVVCFVRAKGATATRDVDVAPMPNVIVRTGNVTDTISITRDGMRGEHFDAVISCMASRTGAPRDAWAIDHDAHVNVLNAAKSANIKQMVLLSAICVQKPLLEFQRAKLAFEQRLIASGLTWSIVRPTAYFKSLSGQVQRVKNGKPYLVFGSGALTACKPISDSDLANYIVDCLHNAAQQNCVLPIGGPGNALTPIQQGTQLFALLGREPRFKNVPVALLDAIIGALDTLGRVIPALKAKAELARIGRYYATESMLVWDTRRAHYDADATPSTGSETLSDYHAKSLRGEVNDDRGEHAVF